MERLADAIAPVEAGYVAEEEHGDGSRYGQEGKYGQLEDEVMEHGHGGYDAEAGQRVASLAAGEQASLKAATPGAPTLALCLVEARLVTAAQVAIDVSAQARPKSGRWEAGGSERTAKGTTVGTSGKGCLLRLRSHTGHLSPPIASRPLQPSTFPPLPPTPCPQ